MDTLLRLLVSCSLLQLCCSFPLKDVDTVSTETLTNAMVRLHRTSLVSDPICSQILIEQTSRSVLTDNIVSRCI